MAAASGQQFNVILPNGQLVTGATHSQQLIGQVPQGTRGHVESNMLTANGQSNHAPVNYVRNNVHSINGSLDNAAAGSAIVLPIFMPAIELHMKPVNTLAHHFQTKPGSDQSKSCNMNPKATHEMRTKMYSNSQGFGTKMIMVECKGNIERMKAAALAAADADNY